MDADDPEKPSARAHGERPSLAVRWGRWVARRRRLVLSIWGVILVVSALAYPHLMNSLVASDYSVTGSDSAEVTELLSNDFSAAGAEQDVVVFQSDTLTIRDPAYVKAVDRVMAAVEDEPGVVAVLGPTDRGAQGQVSEDGHAAIASVGLSGSDRDRADRASDIQDAVADAAAGTPVEAYLTGYSPSANDLTDVENADVERAESFGVPVAFIVLLLALGALVAASVPLITAVFSLMLTFGILSALAGVASFDAFLLSIVTMIGVGVSIDYSLFILFRFREELERAKEDGDPDPAATAVGVAMSTSGRTILFSGTIVIISLFSLFVVRSPLFQEIAIGAVLVVACTLITAWTMLPALLAVLGERVNKAALPKRFRPAETYEEAPEGTTFWGRWARTVLRRPWLALPAVALMLLFALPVLNLQLGIDLGIGSIADTPSGKAVVILEEEFTPGLLSPIQVLVSHDGDGQLDQHDLDTIETFTDHVARDDRVSDVYSVSVLLQQYAGEVSPQALKALEQDPQAEEFLAQTVNVGDGSDRTVVTIVPSVPVDSTDATDLVEDLRNDVIPGLTASGGPQMLVGGETAQFLDLSNESLDKLPIVLGIVLTLSFFYLLLIFRAIVIPLKAVLMNLLATAAAFGLVTWVFQEGHLEGLLGFESVGFIQVYLPIMVFALLFGLSMDYEVFLIRRMQETWLQTHDNEEAVVAGIEHTARPIVAAAAIMAAVFGCFVVADVLELKQFGFALAVAVFLDATLVRLLIVPAFMRVAGPANWWLPAWLDRILPRVRID